MQVSLTEQLKLNTTKEDDILLDDVCKRYAEAATEVSAFYFEKGASLSQKALHQELYQGIRACFGLKSQMAESVLKTVIAQYKTVREQLTNTKQTYLFDKYYSFYMDLDWLAKPICFRRPQADLVRGRDWSFRDNQKRISLNTLGRRVVCSFQCRKDSRIYAPEWKQGTGKLVFHPSDKHWYFHISVTREFPDVTRNTLKQVHGHDRGLINLTTTCDEQGNIHYESGEQVARIQARYDRVRASLQKKGTKGAKRVLKRLSGRENGFRNDVDHRISKTLAGKDHTLHAMENLSGVTLTALDKRTKEMCHQLRSWSFYSLEQKLSYKAAMKGGMVKTFDPAYTSQRCPNCGNIEKSARDRSKHRYVCPVCHAEYNDDESASRNIRELGIRYLNGEESPHF